jgi:high-affinity iron transporter
MDIGSIMQGAIIGFREGLEAFLIIVIMLEYLNKTKQHSFKKNVKQGFGAGVIISIVFGLLMFFVSSLIGSSTSEIAKAWESIVSLIAVVLITTFIVWMIKHGTNMVNEVEGEVKAHLSKKGLVLIAAVMVAREGAEIVLFMAASKDKSAYVVGIVLGLLLAGLLSFLIYKSLVKVNLKVIFNITLAYLILQAGFLLGYSIHEGLSYFKSIGVLSEDSLILSKVYNLADTVLDHKTGAIGIPLYVTLGWYSRPEWIQFIMQYIYTFGLFTFWKRVLKKK